MSIRCTTWVWHEAPIDNLVELLLMLALADEANDEGLSCYAGLRRLAHKCRSGPSTVKGAGQRLHDRGVITVVRPASPSPGRSNNYILHVPWQDPSDVSAYVASITWEVDLAPTDCASRARSWIGDRARDAQNRASKSARNRAEPRALGARVLTNPSYIDPDTPFLPGTGFVGGQAEGSAEADVIPFADRAGIEALRRARNQGEQQP